MLLLLPNMSSIFLTFPFIIIITVIFYYFYQVNLLDLKAYNFHFCILFLPSLLHFYSSSTRSPKGTYLPNPGNDIQEPTTCRGGDCFIADRVGFSAAVVAVVDTFSAVALAEGDIFLAGELKVGVGFLAAALRGEAGFTATAGALGIGFTAAALKLAGTFCAAALPVALGFSAAALAVVFSFSPAATAGVTCAGRVQLDCLVSLL
jgi:hypothetical protein